jgi:hypothetical protein
MSSTCMPIRPRADGHPARLRATYRRTGGVGHMTAAKIRPLLGQYGDNEQASRPSRAMTSYVTAGSARVIPQTRVPGT